MGDLVGTESLLNCLSDTIDGPLDWEAKREVVEALVDDIAVETTGTGRKKTATLTIAYNFSEPVEVVENSTSSSAVFYHAKNLLVVAHQRDYYKPVH